MTPAWSNPDHDPERYLAGVFDALTRAPTRSAAIRLSMQAASVLAGAEGLCLLTAAGDRCTLALAQPQEIYSCDLRSSPLHRAVVRPHRAAGTGARMLWGKEDSITLSTGEQHAIGPPLIVPLEAATGHAAVAFFWQPGQPTAPQRTRQLELLAKTLGFAAMAWRKDDENSARQRGQARVSADLQHRLRNNLALMRSIIRRSHETAESAEHFALHLEARIGALSRTQAMLAAAGESGIELEELVRTELIASAVPEKRWVLQGPAVLLHFKGAESLGLAMHELATNSLKFGALAAPSGSVAITWAVIAEPASPRLHLSWIETGVTIASVAPRRRGFGQELIECTLPYELGARTRLTFNPGGVHCEIDIPLEACVATAEPAAQQAAHGGGPW